MTNQPNPTNRTFVQPPSYTSSTTSTTTTVPQPGATMNNSVPVTTGIQRTLKLNGHRHSFNASMGGREIQLSEDEWRLMKGQIKELFRDKTLSNGKAFYKADLTLRKNPTNNFEFVSAKYHLEGDADETVISPTQFSALGNKDVKQRFLNTIGTTVSSVFQRTYPTQPGTNNTTSSQTLPNPTDRIDVSLKPQAQNNNTATAIEAAQERYSRINTINRPFGDIFYQMARQIENLPIKFGREIKHSEFGIDIGLEHALRKEYATEILDNTGKYAQATKFTAIHDNLKNIFTDVVEKRKFLKLASNHSKALLIEQTKLTQVEIENALTENGIIPETQNEEFIKLYGYYVRDGGNIINESLFLDNFLDKHKGYQYAVVETNGNVSKCSANHFNFEDCLFYQKPNRTSVVLNNNGARVEEVFDESDSERVIDLNHPVVTNPPIVPLAQKKQIGFHYDTGNGNALYISKGAPGQRFEAPVRLLNNDSNWFYEFDSNSGPFEYKFLFGPENAGIENLKWEKRDNRVYNPGQDNFIDAPSFE